MTDVRKPMREQIREIEEQYGIDMAELRRRGAEARRKASDEEQPAEG